MFIPIVAQNLQYMIPCRDSILFFLKWKLIHIANLYVIRSLSYDTKDNMRYMHRLLTISHSF